MDKIESATIFRDKILKCEEYSKLDMAKRSEWGALNFDHVSSELEQLFSICEKLLNRPIEKLPGGIIQQADGKINHVLTWLDRLDKFTLNLDSSKTEHQKIEHGIKQYIDDFCQNIGPWVPFLYDENKDFRKQISEQNESVSTLKKLLEDGKRLYEGLNQTVSNVEKAAAASGAIPFTKDFREEAQKLSTTAQKWLWVTASLGVATLVAACFLLTYATETDQHIGQLIISLGGRIAIIAITLTATLWCGQIYRALRHQSTVNRHRALSLQTFQAFTSATSNQNIKDAVLLEATKTIFSHAPTGYLSSGKDHSNKEDARIIEIVRSSSSTEKIVNDP